MKRLIVTADDFGLTSGVVAGIVDAHEHGIVTATSLMVNAPAAEAAFTWARDHDSLAVGLHFVLTFGRPVGPLAPLGELVDADGRFRRLGSGAHERASAGHVRRELTAQIERFEAHVGRAPTHLDGHHHAHALPGILAAVLEEARERRLPVRSPDDTIRAEVRSAGVMTADRFIDSFYGAASVTEERLLAIVDELPDGTTELMCHPARNDDVLTSLSSYSAPRQLELQTLTSERIREAIAERGIDLRSRV